MTTLDQLAASLDALEPIDSAPFQRRARVPQSIWRSERGYACGEHSARGRTRSMGSRLPEDVLDFLKNHTTKDWPSQVIDRYCDFSKVDCRLGL